MSNDTAKSHINDVCDNALTTVGNVIGDVVTGIPAPMRRNAIRAFNRLCASLVEYPIALIEGAIGEKKAESRARVKLIELSSSQIAEQMNTNPEYARVAAAKYGQKIIRERVNVDLISRIALNELKSVRTSIKDQAEAETPLISEDWLNAFESEAVKLSSEQMQYLFGKILAGEIKNPSSYSIKTVKIIAQLDNLAAVLFTTLCSLSVSLRIDNNHIHDARVVSMGNAGSNSLQIYGLGFDQLNILQEYGLINSDYNSYMDYGTSIQVKNSAVLPFTYQNNSWLLTTKEGVQAPSSLNLHGVVFTNSGKELLNIVDVIPNENYNIVLKNYFEGMGLSMELI